jgi:phage terminase large subunit-like protein
LTPSSTVVGPQVMLLELWKTRLFSAGLGGGLGSGEESGLNRRETLAAKLEAKPEVVSGVVFAVAPPESVTEG